MVILLLKIPVIKTLCLIVVRTIFTGVHRYSYVDTNYAFTDEEEKQRQRQRQIYSDFIVQLRHTRLQKQKER